MIVRCNVITESQPEPFVMVNTLSPEVVYNVPCHRKLVHALAAVSDVAVLPIVRCNVITESQPAAFVVVKVLSPDVVYNVPCHRKLLHAWAVVSNVVL